MQTKIPHITPRKPSHPSIKCAFACLLGFAATLTPARSQTPAASPARKGIEVQVVVLGQTVPPRYEIVSRVRVQELKASGGDATSKDENLPAHEMSDVPLQIAPEEDELPPAPLYIKTGKTWTTIPVRENTVSPKVFVPLTGEIVVATGKISIEENGKQSVDYKPLGSFPVAEGQDGILILIVKDPRQPLKWKIHQMFSVNTSWSKLPAGSFTVVNASYLPLKAQVSDKTIDSVQNFKKVTVMPQKDTSGQVPYMLEVQHPDSSWNTVVNTSSSLGDGGRIIAIPYAVVLPQTKRYASMMVIRDFRNQGGLEIPKKDAGDKTPATPSTAVSRD